MYRLHIRTHRRQSARGRLQRGIAETLRERWKKQSVCKRVQRLQLLGRQAVHEAQPVAHARLLELLNDRRRVARIALHDRNELVWNTFSHQLSECDPRTAEILPRFVGAGEEHVWWSDPELGQNAAIPTGAKRNRVVNDPNVLWIAAGVANDLRLGMLTHRDDRVSTQCASQVPPCKGALAERECPGVVVGLDDEVMECHD